MVIRKSDVISIMGKPNGFYGYPLVSSQDEDAFVYIYTQTSGSSFDIKFFSKSLVVTFDKNGIVKNHEFTSSGKR